MRTPTIVALVVIALGLRAFAGDEKTATPPPQATPPAPGEAPAPAPAPAPAKEG